MSYEENLRTNNEDLARHLDRVKRLYKQEQDKTNILNEKLLDANKKNMDLRVLMVKQLAKTMDILMVSFENGQTEYKEMVVTDFIPRLIRYLYVGGSEAEEESFMSKTMHSIRECGREYEASIDSAEEDEEVNDLMEESPQKVTEIADKGEDCRNRIEEVDDCLSSDSSVEIEDLPMIVEESTTESATIIHDHQNEVSSMFHNSQIEASTPFETAAAKKRRSSAITFKLPELKRLSINDFQKSPLRKKIRKSPKQDSRSRHSDKENVDYSNYKLTPCYVHLKQLNIMEISQTSHVLQNKSDNSNAQKKQTSVSKTKSKKFSEPKEIENKSVVSTRPRRAATPDNLTEKKLNTKMRR